MKGKWTIAGILGAVLLLALAVGFSQAQGPEPPENAVIGETLAAPVPFGIPIQGRLTDASGNPISGSRIITFTLYDSLDNQIWSSGPQAVTMDNNGLFSTAISFSNPSLIDGRELRLGIQVAGDSVMSPHQIIYAVPYAWSLRPGAIISDTRSGAILSVQNYGSGTGVYGYSSNGVAISAGGTGIIKSTAQSYLWISGNGLQKAKSTDVTVFEYDLYGGYLVKPGSDLTNKTVVLPVTIPGQLYGQNVTVTGLDLYYKTSDDTTGITVSAMRRQNGAGAGDQIFWDGTFHSCPPPAACTQHWDLTTNNVLSDQRGILYIAFQLGFGGASSSVQIGGVRLTLEHD